MKKLYYLYRQSLINKDRWIFDDKFKTKENAELVMISNANNSSWKFWKIEEIYEF